MALKRAYQTKKQENSLPICCSKEEFTHQVENDTFDQNKRHCHECIYATSPSCCLALIRNIIYLTKSFAHSFKQSFQWIDSRLDQFLDLFMEQVDDFDDGHRFYQNHNYGHCDFGNNGKDILDSLIGITKSTGRKVILAAHIGLKCRKRLAGVW